jgi:hypothetical protein
MLLYWLSLTGFSEEVGDYVERDEEIATIETDKVNEVYFENHSERILPTLAHCYRSTFQSMLPNPAPSKSFW